MVWQQWRAIQVEAAERARTQSAWILSGALDWARLILREDAKNDAAHPPAVDHLGEPWAVPLAEARLSTFLAVDKDNTDDAPDAFLSGVITDAMARYNLINLLDTTGGIDKQELATLERLCTTVGVSADVASRIAVALRDAAPPVPPAPGASAPAFVPPADPPLMPQSASQLGWLGIDAESLRALEPYIVLIPDTLRFPSVGQRQHRAARSAGRSGRATRPGHGGTDHPVAPARAAEERRRPGRARARRAAGQPQPAGVQLELLPRARSPAPRRHRRSSSARS